MPVTYSATLIASLTGHSFTSEQIGQLQSADISSDIVTQWLDSGLDDADLQRLFKAIGMLAGSLPAAARFDVGPPISVENVLMLPTIVTYVRDLGHADREAVGAAYRAVGDSGAGDTDAYCFDMGRGYCVLRSLYTEW